MRRMAGEPFLTQVVRRRTISIMEETMTVRMAPGSHTGVACVSVLLMIAVTAVVGCASDRPKPMQQPSPEQVKGNADRTFDKLKQEERERKPAGQ